MQKIISRVHKAIMAFAKEPLLQFLLIGVLIFMVTHLITDWHKQQQQAIVVDDGLVRHLENLYNVQFGIYPDKNTLTRLVDNYIREEALYREALKLGLADQDEIVRRRLVQKMEYLLTDSEDNSQQGDHVLMAYYRKHIEDYIQPATVTFRHLYFSEDSNDARQRAMHALQLIRAGNEQQAISEADSFPLQNNYTGLNRREAEQVFGHTDFVQKLFATASGQWVGPYQSGYGWHLLLVSQRSESMPRPFPAVKDQVLSAWQEENRKQQMDAGIRNILGHYQVRRLTKE